MEIYLLEAHHPTYVLQLRVPHFCKIQQPKCNKILVSNKIKKGEGKTLCPWAISKRTTWLPMYPGAPVTNTFMVKKKNRQKEITE